MPMPTAACWCNMAWCAVLADNGSVFPSAQRRQCKAQIQVFVTDAGKCDTALISIVIWIDSTRTVWKKDRTLSRLLRTWSMLFIWCLLKLTVPSMTWFSIVLGVQLVALHDGVWEFESNLQATYVNWVEKITDSLQYSIFFILALAIWKFSGNIFAASFNITCN